VWDLIFIVVAMFIVFPVSLAAWDEYKWHKAGHHRVRRTDLILTGRRERR
jgi:hypothetical protein